MQIKACIKPGCGQQYNETRKAFSDSDQSCYRCGAPIEILKEKEYKQCLSCEDKYSEETSEYEDGFCPKCGRVLEKVKSTTDEKKEKIAIFFGGERVKIFSLNDDQTIIGRSGSKKVDIELDDWDLETRLSRQHILVNKENNCYFVQNLSSNHSVHLNGNLVKKGEIQMLKNQDTVVLSTFIGIKFSI